MVQLGLPTTASGSVVTLGGAAPPLNAVASWGVLWTPFSVLLPGPPALGERVEVTCSPSGLNSSSFMVSLDDGATPAAGVAACPAAAGRPSGSACLAAVGAAELDAASPLPLRFIVAGAPPPTAEALFAVGGFPNDLQWLSGGEGVVCSLASTVAGTSGAARRRYAAQASLPAISVLHLPAVWTLGSSVLVERAGLPGVFLGAGGAGAGQAFGAAGVAACSSDDPSSDTFLVPWSNATLVSSPLCSQALAALQASVASAALSASGIAPPTLSLTTSQLSTSVLVVLAGAATSANLGASCSITGGLVTAAAAVNWMAGFSGPAQGLFSSGASFSLASLSISFPLPQQCPYPCPSLPLILWRGGGGGDGAFSFAPAFSAIAVAASETSIAALAPAFPALVVPLILPLAPLVADWRSSFSSSCLSSPTWGTSHLLPPGCPLAAVARTFGSTQQVLSPNLFPPSSGLRAVEPCAAFSSTSSAPSELCSIPWWGGKGTAYSGTPQALASQRHPLVMPPLNAAACPFGPGRDVCSACPLGATCPGGVRLLPNPGYTIPWEDSPPSLLVSCGVRASPLARCPGWMGAAAQVGGSFSCGAGYMGHSCSSCKPGYYLLGGAECLACPSSPVAAAGSVGGGIGYVLATGLGFFFVGILGLILVLVALGLAFRVFILPLSSSPLTPPLADELSSGSGGERGELPSAFHALAVTLENLCWMWLHCQPLATLSQVTTPLLPSFLRPYFAPLNALQFRGVLAPSVACYVGGNVFQGFWLATAVVGACYALLLVTALPRVPLLVSFLAPVGAEQLRLLLQPLSFVLVTAYGALANSFSEPLFCSQISMAVSDYLSLAGSDGSTLRSSPLFAQATGILSSSSSTPLDTVAELRRALSSPAYASASGLRAILSSPVSVSLLSTPGYNGIVCDEGEHKGTRIAGIVMSALYTAGLPACLILALYASGRIPWLVGRGEGQSGSKRVPSLWDPYVRAFSDCDAPPSRGWWLRPMDLIVLGGLSALPVLQGGDAGGRYFLPLTALAVGLPAMHLLLLAKCDPFKGSWGEKLAWKAWLKGLWLACAVCLGALNAMLFHFPLSSQTSGNSRLLSGLAFGALAVAALAAVMGLCLSALGFAIAPLPLAEAPPVTGNQGDGRSSAMPTSEGEVEPPSAAETQVDLTEITFVNPLAAAPLGEGEGGVLPQVEPPMPAPASDAPPDMERLFEKFKASLTAQELALLGAPSNSGAPAAAGGGEGPGPSPLLPYKQLGLPSIAVSPSRRFPSSDPLTPEFLAALGLPQEGAPLSSSNPAVDLRRIEPASRVVSLKSNGRGASPFSKACRDVDRARMAAQESLNLAVGKS